MSPKTKKQNEVIRQQSIAALKQAALNLFAHKGYSSTSISAIAKEAKVSKGLMYNYFDSKQALLLAIIEDAADLGQELLPNVLDDTTDPKEQLRAIINGTFLWVTSNVEYYKLIASLVFQEEALEVMGDFIKMKAASHIHLGEQLFQKIGYDNPRIMAFEFGALFDGIFMAHLSLKEFYPLEEMRLFMLKKYDLV